MANALPKQVRDQIKAADDIIKQMEAGEESPPEEAVAQDATPEKAEEKPEAPVEAAEKPPEEPAKEPDPDHKYKVLQGKYNAEVPRLQKANTRLEDENRDLRQRILNVEGMIAALATTKEKPSEPPKPTIPEVTEDERAQFGDDLIDLVERVAKRATLPEIENRIGKVSQNVQQVGEKVAQSDKAVAESKRRETISALATAVPDWERQNNDEEFLAWLNENEPSVGVPRGKLLTEAFRANEADRVIWFFKSFQSENVTEQDAAAPAKTAEPQTKLDDLVAPGTPKTGSVSAPTESGKRVWTRNDIAALYAQKNEFIKRGKKVPDELMKLERDLFKAQNENRLR